MKRFAPLAAALALLAFAAPLAAQQCSFPAPDPTGADLSLDLLRRSGYFDRGGCDSSLLARIDRWKAGLARDSADFHLWERPATRDSLSALLVTARARAAHALGTEAPGRERFLMRLDALAHDLSVTGLQAVEAEAWRVQAMRLFAGSPDEIDVAGEVARTCSAQAGACSKAYEDGVELLTYAVLVRDALDAPLANNRAATTQYVAMLDRRWTEYLSKARASYPWEMWLNGFAMRSAYRGRGFIAPPDHQWLFLHPDAGLSYVDPGSDHLRNMVLLEGLGFYRWKWNKSDQITSAMGLAYVLGWEGDDANRVSNGFLLHVPQNLSLGVAWSKNHGKFVPHYIVSGDVGKLFTSRSQLASTLFDAAIRSLH